MNETIETFTRNTIKHKLELLPLGWKRMFSKLYGDSIDNIPADKLDWALTQIENSIIKLNKQNERKKDQIS